MIFNIYYVATGNYLFIILLMQLLFIEINSELLTSFNQSWKKELLYIIMGQKGLYFCPIIYRTAHSLPNSECFRHFLLFKPLILLSMSTLTARGHKCDLLPNCFSVQ